MERQPEPMLTSRFQLSMQNVTGKLNDVTSKTILVLNSRSENFITSRGGHIEGGARD